MLVQPTMGVTKDRARLVSPVFNASGTKCQMSFKYYISGDSTGRGNLHCLTCLLTKQNNCQVVLFDCK